MKLKNIRNSSWFPNAIKPYSHFFKSPEARPTKAELLRQESEPRDTYRKADQFAAKTARLASLHGEKREIYSPVFEAALNALKYASPSAALVFTDESSGRFEVIVSDQGNGISDVSNKYLYSFRAHQRSGNDYENSNGMGLWTIFKHPDQTCLFTRGKTWVKGDYGHPIIKEPNDIAAGTIVLMQWLL